MSHEWSQILALEDGLRDNETLEEFRNRFLASSSSFGDVCVYYRVQEWARIWTLIVQSWCEGRSEVFNHPCMSWTSIMVAGRVQIWPTIWERAQFRCPIRDCYQLRHEWVKKQFLFCLFSNYTTTPDACSAKICKHVRKYASIWDFLRWRAHAPHERMTWDVLYHSVTVT